MKVKGTHYRPIWLNDDGWSVEIIDQTKLPHAFTTVTLKTAEDAERAIRHMQVRGAPLIGATAAYGMCLALRADASDEAADAAHKLLIASRPTAVNLRWALDEIRAAVRNQPRSEKMAVAYRRAAELCDEDAAICDAIGEHGLALIKEVYTRKPAGEPVRVLTHCNAGWLATLDWARQRRRSTKRMTLGFQFMCGPMKPGRATKELF